MAETRELRTMDDVRYFNDVRGFHFFEPGALRFFRSRIGDTLYGRRFFTTSEQHAGSIGPPDPRRYTVRMVGPDGSIEAVGAFQQFETRGGAVSVARACADAGARVAVAFDPYDTDETPAHEAADRYAWRPFIYARGGTYPVGSRNTRAAAEELRAWILRPRWEG